MYVLLMSSTRNLLADGSIPTKTSNGWKCGLLVVSAHRVGTWLPLFVYPTIVANIQPTIIGAFGGVGKLSWLAVALEQYLPFENAIPIIIPIIFAFGFERDLSRQASLTCSYVLTCILLDLGQSLRAIQMQSRLTSLIVPTSKPVCFVWRSG